MGRKVTGLSLTVLNQDSRAAEEYFLGFNGGFLGEKAALIFGRGEDAYSRFQQ